MQSTMVDFRTQRLPVLRLAFRLALRLGAALRFLGAALRLVEALRFLGAALRLAGALRFEEALRFAGARPPFLAGGDMGIWVEGGGPGRGAWGGTLVYHLRVHS